HLLGVELPRGPQLLERLANGRRVHDEPGGDRPGGQRRSGVAVQSRSAAVDGELSRAHAGTADVQGDDVAIERMVHRLPAHSPTHAPCVLTLISDAPGPTLTPSAEARALPRNRGRTGLK